MRFFSKYRPGIYIIQPRRRQVLANGDKVPMEGVGITATFSNVPGGSILDTEDPSHGWTPEQREAVEQHLLSHADYGYVLTLADTSVGAAQDPSTRTCMVMMQVQGGVRLCGRDADETGICEQHQTQLAQTRDPSQELPPPPDAAAAPFDQDEFEEVQA